MSLISAALFCLPSNAFRRAALQVLARETSSDQTARIWGATKSRQLELQRLRPRYSFGLNLLLRYFEWDCALFLAAKEAGFAETTAGQLVEEVNWGVFGPVIELSFSFSRLRGRHIRVRVKWITDLMFKALFTSPFERTTLPETQDVAFNVTTCPIAQYFRERSVPELTRYAACSLDYKMAAVWGVRLERTQTIAEGHSLCDFRFKIHES